MKNYEINTRFIDVFTNAKGLVIRYETLAQDVREDEGANGRDTLASLYVSRKAAIDVALEAAQELCPMLFEELPRGYLEDSILNKRRTLDVMSELLVRSGALEVAA